MTRRSDRLDRIAVNRYRRWLRWVNVRLAKADASGNPDGPYDPPLWLPKRPERGYDRAERAMVRELLERLRSGAELIPDPLRTAWLARQKL